MSFHARAAEDGGTRIDLYDDLQARAAYRAQVDRALRRQAEAARGGTRDLLHAIVLLRRAQRESMKGTA